MKQKVQRSRAPRMFFAMNGSLHVPHRNLGVFFFAILAISVVPSRGFQQSQSQSRHGHGHVQFSLHTRNLPTRRQGRSVLLHSATSTPTHAMTYRPIFDFANQTTVSRFERIDDAIMGGISLSSLKQSADETFARWSGICRLDGGGFCGTRTLPFDKPIQVGQEAEGIYLEYRFTSDEEPERRVWKVTTRSESSRGEQLYQAMFQLTAATPDLGEWNRAEIPFSSFQQVRGPRLVEGGLALNVSNGLYQIGLSLSKFMISKNVTEIPNFRPGFFELQIKEIGIYSGTTRDVNIAVPTTLSKNEIAKKKPLVLKLLLPISTVFFNEKKRRRDSAMRLLRQRGLTTSQAMLFGFKVRAKQSGLFPTMIRTALALVQDLVRASLYWMLRLSLVIPIQYLLRLAQFLKGGKSKRMKPL